VLRIQGILMSLEGVTAGEISNHLKVHRSTLPLWIDHWNRHGQKGLWEGHRSGRPRGLSPEEREKLCDILDSGPTAYGLETGIWTSPRVRQVISGRSQAAPQMGALHLPESKKKSQKRRRGDRFRR
jgi:transposase